MAALIDRSMLKLTRCVVKPFVGRGRCVNISRKNVSTVTSLTLESEDLMKRGLITNLYPNNRPEELHQCLSNPQGMYCGFDPTADSLHIGNLVSILALVHGQRAGHSPIAVVGGATGLIGDPSGKDKDRDVMKAEEIENNIVSLMENVERIFNNHAEYINKDSRKLTPVRVMNNRDWYKGQDVISFMSTTARHFRLGETISRSSVQSRLQSQAGISVTEFMYQIFQASDWLHLYQHHNCSIQVGGNDQTGNIMSGFDLINKVTDKMVFGWMVPLLLTHDGKKLGKSSGNSLWIDPKRTSSFEFYQSLINTPDACVEQYLKLLTVLSGEEIHAIMQLQNQTPEQRHGQRKLAEQVTLLVHGATGLKSAQQCTEVLYGDAITHLRQMELDDLKVLFANAPTSEVTYNPQMSVKDLSLAIGCFRKEAEALQTIKDGGFNINQQRVTDPSAVIESGDFVLPNNTTLVRVGKKRYFIVRWLM